MWRIMFVGGVGGLLPSILDVLQTWNAGQILTWWTTAPNIWLAILVASIPPFLYFCIGAFVAVIYENQNVQKALILGIGAPAFIATTVSDVGKTPQNLKIVAVSRYSFDFVGSAHAQTGPSMQAGVPQVQLDVGGITRVPGCDTCKVTFFGADGIPVGTELLGSVTSGTIDVPANAKVLEFNGDDANAAKLDLEQVYRLSRPAPDGTVTLDVGVNRNLQNDFLRSLGAKSVQPYDFNVKVAPGM